MRKFFLFIACAAVAFSASAAPKDVDFDKLPKNSQEFIRKHFPAEKIKSVELDREASWDKYTVHFNSGSQVSFKGGSGDCSQIIMKNGSVPAGVIPANIRTYTANRYPGGRIVMLELVNDGYKVKLANGTMLYFDKNGNYTKAAK